MSLRDNYFPKLPASKFTYAEEIKGKTITVVVKDSPPMIQITRFYNGSIKSIEGYLADVWRILEDNLQFKTRFLDASNGDFFFAEENRTFPGAFGDLISKRADLSLQTCGITTERKQVMDFSAAIDYDTSKLLLFPVSSLERIDWLMFVTTVFSWKMFLYFTLLWIVSSVILAISSRKDPNLSFLNSIFLLFGSLTLQNLEVIPKRISARIVLIFFGFMCVVVNSMYAALLTTHLTVADYREILSLSQALKFGYKISVRKGSVQHELFEKAPPENTEFRKAFDLIEQNPNLIVDTVEEGIKSTFNKKTLFLFDSSVLYYQTANNCSFAILPPSYFTGYLYIPYRKKFPYHEIIDRKLIRLMATGVLKKLSRRWLKRESHCTKEQEDKPLGLSKTAFGFTFILGAMIVSVIIFFMEIISNRFAIKRKFLPQRKKIRFQD